MTDLVGHDPSPLAERRRAQLLSQHALGLLSESEARDLEAHLAGCAQCCQDWEAIRATVDLVGENIPEEFFDTTRADPDDLIFQGTLRAVRREKRATTWRRLLRPVVAAVVVLVALAGVVGGVVGRATAPLGPRSCRPRVPGRCRAPVSAGRRCARPSLRPGSGCVWR